jgi:putative ABC transport system permease protein
VILILKLAWRNIWRNKRRSILTLLAITFATLSAIAMRGVQIGTYDVNIKNAVEMFTGYIQIQRDGYQDNPSLRLSFKNSEAMTNAIGSVESITSYSERVYGNGLISYDQNSYGIMIFGINPETEANTTKILSKLNDGKFFTSDTSNEVVLGAKLLKNLKAKIGDNVVVLAQGFDGSLGNLRFKIVGTTKTGSAEFDGMAAFMGISTAQDLLALYGNRINAIAIQLDNIREIAETKEKLQSAITDEEISVLGWEEIMPDFKQSIELDNISGLMMLFILIIIVAFGVLNTVLMSVTERFNEFGVTLSIGMPQIKLVYLILIETIFIALIGILIGNLFAWGINYYIVLNPIEFTGDLSYIYEEYGFLPRIESTLDPSIFIANSLNILIIQSVQT